MRFATPQVVLFTADVDRASAFYRRLGFTERFRTPAEGTAIHADLELDGYRIGFALVDSARDDHGLAPATEGQRGTITLWSDDVRAAYDGLTADGVPGLRPPAPWLDRLLVAWVQDPDGHPVQLCQELT